MRFQNNITPLWQVVRHVLIQKAGFDTEIIAKGTLINIKGSSVIMVDKTVDFGDLLDRNPRNPDFFISINVIGGDTIKIYR